MTPMEGEKKIVHLIKSFTYQGFTFTIY